MSDTETALAIPEPAAPLALFGTTDPVQVIEKAARVATALAEVVNKRGLYAVVNGKKFPTVEAWTLCGAMLGVFPITEWVHELHDGKDEVRGFEARVRAQTFGGQIVGAGEARCIRGESKTWHQGAQEFALSSMAQTRATSKALRGPLDFVFKLAGFQPTPAEEMDGIKAVDSDGVVINPSTESVAALKAAQVDSPQTESAIQPAPSLARQSGPRAKRQNVVAAPQGAPRERSVPAEREVPTATPAVPAMTSAPPVAAVTAPGLLDDPLAGPTPLQDEIAKMQAKVEELKAKARERDGKSLNGEAEYMATLRQTTRESAGLLRQLRIRLKNLEGGESTPLPGATPSAESDESLAVFINSQYPGKSLATLGVGELEAISKTLDSIITRVQGKFK